ncbi:MAG TPA: TRAP transporter small permease [Bacillota bacterium]|nr:TRAP transporter small permease [Bacillota bacterium]
MLRKWTQVVNFLEKMIIYFSSTLMGLMAIFVSYQVFSRYVLRYAPYWTEETSWTVMMWVGLLAAACAVWTDSHMELEMVVRRFPQAVQLWLKVFSDAIIAFYAGYVLFDGIRLVQLTMNGVMASLPIAYGITFLVLPISGGLIVLFALTKAVDRIFRFYVLKEEFKAGEGVGVHG